MEQVHDKLRLRDFRSRSFEHSPPRFKSPMLAESCQGDPARGILPGGSCQGDPANVWVVGVVCVGVGVGCWCKFVGVGCWYGRWCELLVCFVDVGCWCGLLVRTLNVR